jgi:hypothetical protein
MLGSDTVLWRRRGREMRRRTETYGDMRRHAETWKAISVVLENAVEHSERA